MSYTYSTTITRTFTRTSAQYIASKVVADLRRMLIYYGKPSERKIYDYYEELTEMLAHGYMESVEYGFKRNGQRVVSLQYVVRADGTLGDDRAGGVYARADISGTTWFSYMTYTGKWWNLSDDERERFEAQLPIQRSTAPEPEDGYGYWVVDRAYTADGVGTQRQTFRPY